MIDEYILGTRDDAIHCEYFYAYVLLVRKVGMQRWTTVSLRNLLSTGEK